MRATPGPRPHRRRAVLGALALLAASRPAGTLAAACAGAGGIAGRTLAAGTRGGLFVGLKSYPQTLPLAPGDVVLTFDDGPWPGTTSRILDALACAGARATFFMIGRNVDAHPALARRVLAEGHAVGCHSWSHPNMRDLPGEAAIRDVERGFAALRQALGREPAPFFRFPFFADCKPVEDWCANRDIGVFGADFWASDWNPMTPQAELALVDARLDKAGRGIVLFHDTKAQTAAMLPDFLAGLGARGRRVVHLVPGPGQGPVEAAPAGWRKAVP